jgi:hypothetical protein
VPLLGVDRREVKARANGFLKLYQWLGDHDFPIVRADRSEPLVIVPFSFAVEIAKAAENSRISVKGAPDAVIPARAT